MKNLIASLRELAGLFVEDGALALAIIVVAGAIALLAPTACWLSGLILLCGCLGVLIANVMTAKRGEAASHPLVLAKAGT